MCESPVISIDKPGRILLDLFQAFDFSDLSLGSIPHLRNPFVGVIHHARGRVKDIKNAHLQEKGWFKISVKRI